jgi:hypothetical protein
MFRYSTTIGRSLSRIGRCLVLALTCLGLCVATWQAPLPWVHFHQPDVQGLSRAELQEHLNACHAGAAVTDEHHWHLHFAMLAEILHGHGHPRPCRDSDETTDRLVPVVVMPSGPAIGPVCLDCNGCESAATAELLAPMAITVQHRSQCAHPLERFTAAHEMRALFAIARC